MVAEADESDRSFLKLFPTLAVITNIDHEHLENYGGFDDLLQAFVDFANKVPFYGAVVCCADDTHLACLLPRMTRRVITYGTERPADVTATDVELGPLSVRATIHRRVVRDEDGVELPAAARAAGVERRRVAKATQCQPGASSMRSGPSDAARSTARNAPSPSPSHTDRGRPSPSSQRRTTGSPSSL